MDAVPDEIRSTPRGHNMNLLQGYISFFESWTQHPTPSHENHVMILNWEQFLCELVFYDMTAEEIKMISFMITKLLASLRKTSLNTQSKLFWFLELSKCYVLDNQVNNYFKN